MCHNIVLDHSGTIFKCATQIIDAKHCLFSHHVIKYANALLYVHISTILYNLLNNIENNRQVVETNLIPFGAENLTFNCEKINVDILQNISLLISHLKPSGTGLEWRINIWRINYLFLVIYDFKSVT